MIPFDKKRIITLAGTLVLAGAVVAAGVYGPSVWKVLGKKGGGEDPTVTQSPIVSSGSNPVTGTEGMLPDGTAPPSNVTPTTTTPSTIPAPPQGDTGSKSKYKEPDIKLMDLAPSTASFFGENALSNDAKTLIFGTAWNIHQYVDGYLFGLAAGPQLNEQDIKKYIMFHKTLLDKQMKNEANVSKVTALTSYLDILLNKGIDAFDSKDKVRIEQFHQEIHDLDTHLMRNDVNSKIYGATPFATKR